MDAHRQLVPLPSMDIKTPPVQYTMNTFRYLSPLSPSINRHQHHQYPTPKREPLSPAHSRNSSMAQELLSLAKNHPHRRTMMKINDILTPPNSAETKPIHSFQDERSDTQSDHGDFNIHRRTSSQSSAFHNSALFPEGQTHFQAQLSNVAERQQAVAQACSRKAPEWDVLEHGGCERPAGVGIWRDLTDDRGNLISRPTAQEYNAFLDFLAYANGVSAKDGVVVTHSEGRKRRRTSQQGAVAKRRSTPAVNHTRKASSTPSLTEDRTSNTGARRRQAKVNLKPNGAEGRQARAPSTKEQKDMDWKNYIDYAPQFTLASSDYENLAYRARAFDKDNKKEPKDLSNDPEVHELHPAERIVAELLHLDCHRFLASKRQIFTGYVNLLKLKRTVNQRVAAGLEQAGETKTANWNKTEAQKLLGIDVSKGSWIWQFYKDLGWFEPENENLFSGFVNEVDAQAMQA